MRLETFPRNGTLSNTRGQNRLAGESACPTYVGQTLSSVNPRSEGAAAMRPTLLPSQSMDPSDRERYSRQILFPGIGERGQEALLNAHAVIAGCGALGSFHAAALARAGVGRLTVIDRDYLEPSNLHRQWLFEESDAAQALPKAAAAERRIARINSSIRARGVIADLTSANVAELLGDADIILDGTDNFETRYLINDFAVSRGIPWVYGAAVASYGITMPVIAAARRVCAASTPIRQPARSPPAKPPAC